MRSTPGPRDGADRMAVPRPVYAASHVRACCTDRVQQAGPSAPRGGAGRAGRAGPWLKAEALRRQRRDGSAFRRGRADAGAAAHRCYSVRQGDRGGFRPRASVCLKPEARTLINQLYFGDLCIKLRIGLRQCIPSRLFRPLKGGIGKQSSSHREAWQKDSLYRPLSLGQWVQ